MMGVPIYGTKLLTYRHGRKLVKRYVNRIQRKFVLRNVPSTNRKARRIKINETPIAVMIVMIATVPEYIVDYIIINTTL